LLFNHVKNVVFFILLNLFALVWCIDSLLLLLHVVGWSVNHWLVQVAIGANLLLGLDVHQAAFHLRLDDIHDVTDDLRSMLQVFLIRHLFLVDGISIKLWIWRGGSKRRIELVGRRLMKLTLDVIELLLVLKVGSHVVEIRDLVTKLVKEVVFLVLVDVAVTAYSVSAWLVAWIAWVLFNSITRVRLS